VCVRAFSFPSFHRCGRPTLYAIFFRDLWICGADVSDILRVRDTLPAFRANTERTAIAQTAPHFVSRFPFLRALPNASPLNMCGCVFAVCVRSLSSGVLWSNTYDVSLLLVFCHCVMLSALPLKHVVANHPVGEYFYYY
jgi:hypothetical protein